MTKYIAIDLDGCVSDDTWRLPLIDHSIEDLDKRYHSYCIQCDSDQPITENIALIDAILKTTKAIPLIVTARPEYTRKQTELWMQGHLPFTIAPHCLLMRPDGNSEHSYQLKPCLLHNFKEFHSTTSPEIILCFDDREDVIEHLTLAGYEARLLRKPQTKSFNETHVNDVDCILRNMANTYRERNAAYGNNYKMIAPMVDILFPDGVPANTVISDQWHLFELILVKLSRFAISGLQHTDSIHDAAVYCAMIESIIKKQKEIGR